MKELQAANVHIQTNKRFKKNWPQEEERTNERTTRELTIARPAAKKNKKLPLKMLAFVRSRRGGGGTRARDHTDAA